MLLLLLVLMLLLLRMMLEHGVVYRRQDHGHVSTGHGGIQVFTPRRMEQMVSAMVASMVTRMVIGRKVVEVKVQGAREIANAVYIQELVEVIVGCRMQGLMVTVTVVRGTPRRGVHHARRLGPPGPLFDVKSGLKIIRGRPAVRHGCGCGYGNGYGARGASRLE